jgi:hypothetical protein
MTPHETASAHDTGPIGAAGTGMTGRPWKVIPWREVMERGSPKRPCQSAGSHLPAGEEREIGIWLALVASLGIRGWLATRERPATAAPPRAARRAASSCGLVVRGVEMRVAWIRATDLAAV